jgi:hypothetical protein
VAGGSGALRPAVTLTAVRRGLIALALLLVITPAAVADGDPASDTLVTRNVFLPYPAPSAAAASALAREVRTSYVRGFRVKVAVIATESDLGSVPSLFNRPGDYAKFLGQELELYYIGPLLIVMPAGYGIYDGGRSTAAERKVLSDLHPSGSSADELTTSATTVVHKLVAVGALKSKDIKAPYVAAFAATVTAGRTARLRYTVFDDSGKTRERLAVRDGGSRVLATWTVPLRATSATKTYSVSWRVPSNVTTRALKFCVAAYDPSGNRPAPSCAHVAVRS